MTTTPYELVVSKLDAVTGNGVKASARCPAHDDRTASLSITEGDAGKVVVHCHAGCSVNEIVAAIGLNLTDLFPHNSNGHTERRVVAAYNYTDQNGHLQYQVVRYHPKDFRQRRPDSNGGWIWRLDDTPRILYHLPQLVTQTGTVFIVEGEKDADALTAAGYLATCGPGGAGTWNRIANHAAQILAGRNVIIVADKDPVGYKHARDVAHALHGTANTITVVEAATGKDAADHLAAGHTVDDFVIINIDDQAEEPTEPEDGSSRVDPSYQPVELAPILTGNYQQPVPLILEREDGQALLYPASINGIHGPSGEGKGWIALHATTQELHRGHNVILIDLEDNAPSIIARLRLLGAYDTEIGEHLIYIRPSGPFGHLETEHLANLTTSHQPSLLIIDSLGEAFGLDGIDENSDAEVGPWLRRIPRRLAELGPAVLLIDHSTKANDNPLFPSGSKRKRAAITGASYLVTATTPLAAGKGGRLRLTCAKDRHGSYARGEHVADLAITATPGGIKADLYTGHTPGDNTEPVVELAILAILKAALTENRPLSQRALVEATSSFKCRMETKRAAIDLAVARGLLHEVAGPRNARLFEAVKDPQP